MAPRTTTRLAAVEHRLNQAQGVIEELSRALERAERAQLQAHRFGRIAKRVTLIALAVAGVGVVALVAARVLHLGHDHGGDQEREEEIG